MHSIPKFNPLTWSFGICLALFALVLLFTRFGVFLVFDVAGDLRGTDNFNTRYTDAPVTIMHVLDDAKDITLPTHIEQVSGIVAREGTIALSTDQAELFILTLDEAQDPKGGNLFPLTPLLFRQGSIESVTQVKDEFWLAGERGEFLRTDLSGTIIGTHPLPDPLKTADITGLAWAEEAIFVTTDDTMTPARVDIPSGDLHSLPLDFGAVSDQPIAQDAFLWSGLAYDAGRLYLIAENYPVIIVADAVSGRVLETIGVTGIHEFSDISVSNGTIILPSDHNYFDQRPPLLIYPMPI